MFNVASYSEVSVLIRVRIFTPKSITQGFWISDCLLKLKSIRNGTLSVVPGNQQVLSKYLLSKIEFIFYYMLIIMNCSFLLFIHALCYQSSRIEKSMLSSALIFVNYQMMSIQLTYLIIYRNVGQETHASPLSSPHPPIPSLITALIVGYFCSVFLS